MLTLCKFLEVFVLSTIFLFLSISHSFSAPNLPDAGAVRRDTLPTSILEQPNSLDLIKNNENKQKENSDTTPIKLQSIKIIGATVFSDDELQDLIAKYSNITLTLGDLQLAAARITALYREAGYFLARAYLPEQRIEDGIVTIKVLEGVLGEIELENNSHLSDAKVRDMLTKLKQGTILHFDSTNRAMLLLSDLNGVEGIETRVEPGANTGETNLITTLSSSSLFTGGIELDNYGSLYSGRYRVGGNINLNSPFGYGEQFSARLLVSDEELYYGRLGAQLPIGNDGLVLSGGYNHTQYSLGDSFDPLDARGNLDSVDLTLRYPFIRSQRLNVYGALGAEYRKLKDEIRSTDTKTDKNAKVGNASIFADWRDNFGGGGANQVGLIYTQGTLDIETAIAAAIDALGAKTEGNYSKWNWNVSRQQAITQSFTLSLQARGQYTSDNLDSAEKFVLGGPFGVRAYPTGEGAADIGWLANVELRYAVLPQMIISAFYDAGGIEVNADPFLTTSNTRDLAGYGFGLNGFYKAIDWRAAVAWRTTSDSIAEPDKTPRFWLNGGWRF